MKMWLNGYCSRQGHSMKHSEVRRAYKEYITKTCDDESGKRIVESQSYCEREQSYRISSALVCLSTMVFCLVRMSHGMVVVIVYIFSRTDLYSLFQPHSHPHISRRKKILISTSTDLTFSLSIWTRLAQGIRSTITRAPQCRQYLQGI